MGLNDNPRVTVIIPTFNWSSALRCSIMSVLYQSFREFELLVIGDACSDDSEAVALSFSDPRLQWRNLPERCGSQSGPNNEGLRAARGRYIAYLGHDDVWHPGHLEHLVAAMERHNADLATAVAVMYGPPGSGVRGLSGVFVEGADRPDDFFPPSAMMHRRELMAEIGEWRLPDAVAQPVDCDFLQRARAANARIVSSGRLTAFKFNAAWRRDSYLHRNTREQQAMLARLEADAAGCAEAELVGLLQASREKRLIETMIPGGEGAEAGAIYHAYMRYRGLETATAPPLTGRRRFPPAKGFAGLEWHPPEEHPEWGTVRWSGPALEASMVLPVTPAAGFRLRIQLLNWFHSPVSEDLRILVNGTETVYELLSEGPGPAVQLSVPSCASNGGAVHVRFAAARVRCPYFLWPGRSNDTRWLGICLHWIEIEPT